MDINIAFAVALRFCNRASDKAWIVIDIAKLMISLPMSEGIVVGRQQPMLNDTARIMKYPVSNIRVDNASNAALWYEVVEAIPFVWDDKKIISAVIQNVAYISQVLEQVRLVFDAVAAEGNVKPIIDHGQITGC